MRIKVPLIRRSEGASRLLENRLRQTDGILKAEARPATGSVILFYDPKSVSAEELIASLSRTIERAAEVQQSTLASPRKDRTRSLLYPLLNVIVLSGYLGLVIIRRLFFKAPLPAKALSGTGAVATLGALPLFRRAWVDLRGHERMGLFPFLAGACGLAILMGEALTALEIIWVLSLGMLLEEFAAERARRAVRDILEVSPRKAFVLLDGAEVETPVSELRTGNVLAVHAGEMIAVDGVVKEGGALVDEAHITGRSEPALREPGDRVYAGTRVVQGAFSVKALKVGEETDLAGVARLVEESLSSRSEAEKEADLLASRLTRIGVASTLATILLTRSFSRAFSVLLVVACPCATVLAASTAVAAAIANAARRQILVRGGVYLEQVGKIHCFCFDKTGTITIETPHVVAVRSRAPNQNTDGIVLLAASAEAESGHPMAKALTEEARKRGLDLQEGEEYEVFLGRGIRAKIGRDLVAVGNARLMEEQGVSTAYFKKRAGEQTEAGNTVLYVARKGKLQGMIAAANTLRKGAKAAIDRLREEKIEMRLISGDTAPVVRSLSEQLGFDDYRHDLLPEEKAHYIDEIQQSGPKVLMVGDGVNDALALSKAAVGVSMGAGGSEVAVEASDIALVRSDLGDLVLLRRLSGYTLNIIQQNFWMATLTNGFGILFGATGWLRPLAAGMLHVGHTLAIMLNSSRIIHYDPEP